MMRSAWRPPSSLLSTGEECRSADHRVQSELTCNTAPALPPQPDTAKGARMLYWGRLVAMAAGVTDANH